MEGTARIPSGQGAPFFIFHGLGPIVADPRISFHHQPEAQHPNLQLSTRTPADYPI